MEYTPIFEEYIELTNKAIDATLHQEHNVSKKELADFIGSFDTKMKVIEAVEPEVLDLLFKLVDF